MSDKHDKARLAQDRAATSLKGICSTAGCGCSIAAKGPAQEGGLCLSCYSDVVAGGREVVREVVRETMIAALLKDADENMTAELQALTRDTTSTIMNLELIATVAHQNAQALKASHDAFIEKLGELGLSCPPPKLEVVKGPGHG